MNRDRLLADAKKRALALVEGYKPPEPPVFVLPGPSGRAGLYSAAEAFHKRGIATDHDLVVADALAEVLSGGDTDIIDTVDEQTMLDLERRAFMRLVRTGPTLARIEHTLGDRQAVAELGGRRVFGNGSRACEVFHSAI